MPRKEEGFTLIELVVVIVIIGILAAIALPRFMDLNQDAKIAATKGNLAAIRGGISLAHGKILASGNNTGATGDNPDWPTLYELANNRLDGSGSSTNRPNKVSGLQIYQTSEPGGATRLPDVQLPEMSNDTTLPDDVYRLTASEAEPDPNRFFGTGPDSTRWAYYPGDDPGSNLEATFYVLDGTDTDANRDGDGQLPYKW